MMATLDKDYQIEFFKLAQVCMRLKLEIEVPGMNFGGSTLKPAKRYYNLKVSRRAQALEILTKAKDEALAHPTHIWVILARVRGSRVFIVCDSCAWQGDEFTVGTGRIVPDSEQGWYCPKCRHDESSLVITPLEEVVTLA